ncbi:hypothetical protein Y032_0063g3433 [Ancylostoma ceylanicum]|uniref:Uncharacterized protein n=1 Tax=Ancylostoma ceylanicum TaxID=53326 RepID=A0A016U2T8_9BILA|nr:hypothetical protein Y032_0063g3433 [Ancylostoma ceylanicum]
MSEEPSLLFYLTCFYGETTVTILPKWIFRDRTFSRIAYRTCSDESLLTTCFYHFFPTSCRHKACRQLARPAGALFSMSLWPTTCRQEGTKAGCKQALGRASFRRDHISCSK